MPVINTDPLANDKAVVLWFNRLELTGNEYFGDDPLNPGSNALTDTTYDYWKQAGSGITTIKKVGTVAPVTSNAFGVSGHNLGTTGSKIYLRGSNDDVNFVNIIEPYAPLTDEDLLFIYPTVSYTYINVIVGESTGAYVTNIKLGSRLEFPCTPIVGYTPVNHSWRYQKYFNNSIEGHLLGNRVRAKGGTTTVSFPEIPRSFVDNELPGFEDHYARGRTFFYAGWPNGQPKDMGYCRASGENDAVNVSYTGGSKLATVNFGINIHGQ